MLACYLCLTDCFPEVTQVHSASIIEVPDLANVDMFFSTDPAFLSTSQLPMSKDHTSEQLQTASLIPGPQKSIARDFAYSPIVLEQATSLLASSWKFNPFLGASSDAFQPVDPIDKFTKEELKFVKNCKTCGDSRPREVALRHHQAVGSVELNKINRRLKDQSIVPWGKDIPKIDDHGFTQELDAFYGARSLRPLEIPDVQLSYDSRGDYQEVSSIVFSFLVARLFHFTYDFSRHSGILGFIWNMNLKRNLTSRHLIQRPTQRTRVLKEAALILSLRLQRLHRTTTPRALDVQLTTLKRQP